MAILILLTTGVIITIAAYKAPPTTDLSVLRDVTDMHLSQPKAEELYGFYDFTGDKKWSGASFRYSNLSDVSYNRVSEAKIDNANQWFSNELARDKTIQKFHGDFSKIITDASADSIGREHSAVYVPVATELIRLSQSKDERRVLIVYSDLMENDLDLSLYSKDELHLLKSNPEALRETFEKRKALPSLSGVEVYLVYQPQDAETDYEYHLVSEFYKSLLESKGATVHIAANLTN